jgi:hypothetical protein
MMIELQIFSNLLYYFSPEGQFSCTVLKIVAGIQKTSLAMLAKGWLPTNIFICSMHWYRIRQSADLRRRFP